jgi:hypothetical protein
MNFVALAFLFAVIWHPHEYAIDCTGWNGGAVIEYEVVLTALDGTAVGVGAELQPVAGQEAARHSIWSALDDAGWRTRKVGKGILIVEGAKTCDVLWITSTSKQWAPVVTLVFK